MCVCVLSALVSPAGEPVSLHAVSIILMDVELSPMETGLVVLVSETSASQRRAVGRRRSPAVARVPKNYRSLLSENVMHCSERNTNFNRGRGGKTSILKMSP